VVTGIISLVRAQTSGSAAQCRQVADCPTPHQLPFMDFHRVAELHLLQVQRAGDAGTKCSRCAVSQQLPEGAAVPCCRLAQELPYMQQAPLCSG
jgi:hypothetical protein